MMMYTTSDNEYRSEAFCLVPDDDEREVAYPNKVESLTSMCEENGWNIVSMANDFKTIYGDGVTKDESNSSWLDSMLELYGKK